MASIVHRPSAAGAGGTSEEGGAANKDVIAPAIMSVASLQAFCSKVAADDVLRSKVHAAAGVDDIVEIASAHGHVLDKTVLLREHAKAICAAPDHALSGINSWGDALMHCFGASQVETEL